MNFKFRINEETYVSSLGIGHPTLFIRESDLSKELLEKVGDLLPLVVENWWVDSNDNMCVQGYTIHQGTMYTFDSTRVGFEIRDEGPTEEEMPDLHIPIILKEETLVQVEDKAAPPVVLAKGRKLISKAKGILKPTSHTQSFTNTPVLQLTPTLEEPEPNPNPASIEEPEPVSEPAPIEGPELESESEPDPIVEPAPTEKTEPEPASIEEPEHEPEPASIEDPEPESVSTEEPESELKSASIEKPEPEQESASVEEPDPEPASIEESESEPASTEEPEHEPEPVPAEEPEHEPEPVPAEEPEPEPVSVPKELLALPDELFSQTDKWIEDVPESDINDYYCLESNWASYDNYYFVDCVKDLTRRIHSDTYKLDLTISWKDTITRREYK